MCKIRHIYGAVGLLLHGSPNTGDALQNASAEVFEVHEVCMFGRRNYACLSETTPSYYVCNMPGLELVVVQVHIVQIRAGGWNAYEGTHRV